MTDGYRHGLNRFIPGIYPGHALLVPNPGLPGKFRIVEDGERFASTAVLKTQPIGKLVDPQEFLPWKAPTVVCHAPQSASRHSGSHRPITASDYRYIQRVARDRTALPVLNFDNGRIYNLAPLLRAIDLLDYGRLLYDAARYSMYESQTKARPSADSRASPLRDSPRQQAEDIALTPVAH